MRRWIVAILAAGLALGGCSSAPEPVRDSREALGTVVSVTAYPTGDTDEAAARAVIDTAYDEMAAVEAALDAHDPDSAISKINAVGRGTLPTEALEVFSAREALGVEAEFSPFLLEVIALYDFEDGGTIPDARMLESYVRQAQSWQLTGREIGRGADNWKLLRGYASGLDFGGAAKGLALDRAAGALQDTPAIEAALVTAGSTTVTLGTKPDGTPWRVGVEDPRDPDATVATVEADGAVTVSTSGDYQRYFERDGVRYHHILDPATGLPAHGLRSLTIVGAATGLDSDILSTALFVMGAQRATDYAQAHALGLVLVDDKGRVRVVPGPEDANWRIVETTP